MVKGYRNADHSTPLAILEVLVGRAPDALRPMQAEQAIVELPHDVLRAQEVVEQPLLAERPDVGAEDRRRVRPEVPRLVDGDEHVLELERLELEVTRLCLVAERGRVEGVVRIPRYRTAIYGTVKVTAPLGRLVLRTEHPTNAFDNRILNEALARPPTNEGEGDIDGVDAQIKHRVVLILARVILLTIILFFTGIMVGRVVAQVVASCNRMPSAVQSSVPEIVRTSRYEHVLERYP